MNDLAKELSARFHLLERIFVQQQELDSAPEPLPPFLRIFMAGMEADQGTPLCFILPRCGEIARLAAVVYALHRFASAKGELTKGYGETNFSEGDVVRIHPGRHVFRYCGFDPDLPDFICLRPINGTERDRWRVRAATFVPRLELTTLNRPIGKMNSPIHDPDPAPLDQVIGTSTFGNQRLFRNELLLLDSAAGFRRFVEVTAFRPPGISEAWPSLKAVVPFGELSPPTPYHSLWLKKWDDRNPTGEPLVAVTSSPETLANFCIDAPFRSKLVVVNGISRVKDLQSFDDIHQTQRLVLFADHDDDELIEALGNRGCRFWEITASELNAGVSAAATEGMFGRLRIWARNKEALTLDTEACENRDLEDVCIRLEGLRHVLIEKEEGPVTKLVARIWKILNDAAAVVRPLREGERQPAIRRLKEFEQQLRGNRAWIPPDAERELAQSAAELESLLNNRPDFGASKRAALERVVESCLHTTAASVVLVRSEEQAAEIGEQFRRHINSGRLRVCTSRTLKANVEVDRVICLSWPGGVAMRELARSLTAPRITLLGYPFERRWLSQCAHRLRRRPIQQCISAAEKAVLMGSTEGAATLWPVVAQVEDAEPVTGEDDIWAFEQRLRAARKGTAAVPTQASETTLSRYVSFVGTAYAFLTETHGVVVVTELLLPGARKRKRLPEKIVGDLKQGDFIVFPASGDRELIQEKADQLIGSDAPKLRKAARVWKEALRASQLTPVKFLGHARDLGRPHHIMTIRNWFADSPQIGPGTGDEDLSEDLELVALVTDHEPLKMHMDKTIEAIKALRSAHLSAGVRLRDVLIQRLPEVIGRVDDEGSVVDLGDLGSAWIVQVELIATTTEPRGRGEVNRLLWEGRTLNGDSAL